MNIVVDLNTVLMVIVGGLVSWAVAGIRAINRKLSELNGAVRELNVWKQEHTKLDDERQSMTEKAFDVILTKKEK